MPWPPRLLVRVSLVAAWPVTTAIRHGTPNVHQLPSTPMIPNTKDAVA
jgi:hypothetical protein